ncbi:ABC transporter ATP-binding protein [Microvirga alba]|uniref:ABC transporter ATP-binding protein n=1 Tax=Microvirga alba TaxID=2791025 RepID=A0A931FSK5_9HYPH|nr:ABC transporter ATP-binding protein [Microvirga alba]MBF9235718.1 ABC transporter ATP-binding protein [Microvirga alba]
MDAQHNIARHTAAPLNFSVRDLTKVFQTPDGPVTAVRDVSFEITGDTFFTMLGPSGCGKTTTLRMIAGLETISSGEIRLDGADFRKKNAFERNIGMVFQSYALFPHMTVFENAAYGLRLRGADGTMVRQRVTETLAMLRLEGLAQRYPADLSGGQQQRVSIARALVYRPGILLLDEPLANLDAKLRVEMRDEIRRLQKTLGVMALYVTHDQEEAMAVSDRIAVFSKGLLMQVGSPYEIYTHPTSLFVADFIGKANFFPVDVDSRDRDMGTALVPGGARFVGLPVVTAANGEAGWFSAPHKGLLMVRPEKMWLSAAHGTKTIDASSVFTGRAVRIQFLGTFVRYLVESPAARGSVIIDLAAFAAGVTEGAEVYFGLKDDGMIFVEAAS